MNQESLRPGLKTWSALSGNRKRPSEYEVLTYKLHTRTVNPDAPYEQDTGTAMNRWYKKYVVGSPLVHDDWDAFRDPDQVTYRAYTTMQDGQEQFVDGLLDIHSESRHDASLSAEWVDVLAKLYTPGRYLVGAGQMVSAYLVQTAPASTITNCAAFQEADQLRWVSRTAYRTRELANTYPDAGFASAERFHFELSPEWQGFRELVEKSMVTYDWAECFFVWNVITARAIDEAWLHQLGAAARRHDDGLTGMLADNQMKDSERSRRWTAALMALALTVPENRAVLAGWEKKWVPLAEKAIDDFCAALPDSPQAGKAAKDACAAFRREIGLD